MIRIIPRYEDNKTYPILVKLGRGYMIVEMLGKLANAYNDSLPKPIRNPFLIYHGSNNQV